MYRKIMTLICLFCLCFSCSAYAERMAIGEKSDRTDYTAYMNVSIPDPSSSTAMLLFRAKDIDLLGYGLSYYEVGFEKSSKLTFRKFYTGYFRTYTVTVQSVDVNTTASEKKISVDAIGNTFKIYLDGEQVIDYTDNGTYNNEVTLIPSNLTGDIGYRVDGSAQILSYGAEDYNTNDTHIESVEVTGPDGNIIKDGSYIPPSTELNYYINFTDSYGGASIVAAKDKDGNLLEADVEQAPGNVKAGTIVSPANKGYFSLTEFAWDSLATMSPIYAKSKIAEFNSKKVVDFYNRTAISENEEYTIDREHFMTGSSTESVNIYFSNESGRQDVAGLVLASVTESDLHGINCYRAVIRNKSVISLEKVYDGVTTVLAEYSLIDEEAETEEDGEIEPPVNEWKEHNLKLHIYGSRISIYFDNEKIIQYLVPDIFYLSGYPGIYKYGKGIDISDIAYSN